MIDPKTQQEINEERQCIDDEYQKHWEETGELADDWRNAAYDETEK